MYCYYKRSVTLPHDPWVGLQCVIVVFPNHTHLLFAINEKNSDNKIKCSNVNEKL